MPPNDKTKRSIDLSFGVIVVILNIIEVIFICKLKRKKKIYEVLLLSLSIADLLFGLSNGVISTIFLSNSNTKEVLEITYTTFFYFVTTSIFHLLWITLDRVWAVYSPFKHNTIVTRKKVYALITATWVLTTLTALSMFLYDELTENTTTAEKGNSTSTTQITATVQRTRIRPKRRTRKERYQDTVQFVLSILILIADLVLAAANCFIIYLVNKKSKVSQINTSITDYKNKVSVLCIFVAVIFVLFTLPYALAGLIVDGIPMWANLILVSNSGVNCIVYFFRGKYGNYIQKRREKKHDAQYKSSTTPIIITPMPTPQSTPASNKNLLKAIDNNSLSITQL